LLALVATRPAGSRSAPVLAVLADYLVGDAKDEDVAGLVTWIGPAEARRDFARYANGQRVRGDTFEDWWRAVAAMFSDSADEQADLDSLEKDADSPVHIVPGSLEVPPEAPPGP